MREFLLRNYRSKAIRLKCLECSGDNQAEVRRCHLFMCPLWPFRFGTGPETMLKDEKRAMFLDPQYVRELQVTALTSEGFSRERAEILVPPVKDWPPGPAIASRLKETDPPETKRSPDTNSPSLARKPKPTHKN